MLYFIINFFSFRRIIDDYPIPCTPDMLRTIEDVREWLTGIHIDGYLSCLQKKGKIHGWWDEVNDCRYAVHGTNFFVSIYLSVKIFIVCIFI